MTTTGTIPRPGFLPIDYHCPAGCGLADMILCWLAEERRLRCDLATATRADDREVLSHDLAAAEARVDALIALGRGAV